jgi:hypothetical protein
LAVGALDIPYYSEIKVLGLIKSWLNIFYWIHCRIVRLYN